jgi:D-arabinose 1-dehydrogenase-like Zn-dependent alcohol dehydrogenase
MSDNESPNLPSTCRGLVCRAVGQPLNLEFIPTPDAVPGSVVIKVLAATVDHTILEVLKGHNPSLTFPTPFIPGSRCVGRIVATGPDTTSLQVGQLVMTQPFIRGRDDTDVQILWGLSEGASPMSKKLMEDSWRHGVYKEYVRAPLENCYALNEKVLLGSSAEGGLGYSVADLTHISMQLVAYGGLRGIDLKAGETVIVAPATGGYSGAAVEVASAMGARVIAVGRNMTTLKKVAEYNPRVFPVQLNGNVEEDTATLQQFGKIDAYIDISPATASKSTHVRSCLMALKPYGRASLMGVIDSDIAIPYVVAMSKNLTIRGQFMYEREDVIGIIKLAETGVLKLGKSAGQEVVAQFPLEEWQRAFETATNNPEAGKIVLLTP